MIFSFVFGFYYKVINGFIEDRKWVGRRGVWFWVCWIWVGFGNVVGGYISLKFKEILVRNKNLEIISICVIEM